MSGKIHMALSTDSAMEALGVVHVFSDYSAEEIPREGLTVILRWGDENFQRSVQTGPRDLAVWVHSPMENGTDYTVVNRVLNRVTDVLTNIVQETGDDGVRVTSVDKGAASGNLRDPGFNTICRNRKYQVLLHDVV